MLHTSRVDVADEQQRRAWRRAWIIPLAAMSVAGAAATALRDAGVSPPQVMSVCFFVGAMGGAGWQVLNRRDFVDRFFGWSLMLAVVMLLIALPGVESSAGGGAGAFQVSWWGWSSPRAGCGSRPAPRGTQHRSAERANPSFLTSFA